MTTSTTLRPGDMVRFRPQWIKDIGFEEELAPMRGRIIRITQSETWEVARVAWADGYFGRPETSALTRNLERLEITDDYAPSSLEG